jgi:hypothetical protein
LAEWFRLRHPKNVQRAELALRCGSVVYRVIFDMESARLRRLAAVIL